MIATAGMYCTSFEGYRRIAAGELRHVAQKTKEVLDGGENGPVLIFDNATSEMVEIDFRGDITDVLKRLPNSTGKTAVKTCDADTNTVKTKDLERQGQRGPGRPKLGVVAREVTLLPRHWEWLNDQPGGASVALRKLVEAARRTSEPKDRVRKAQESAYRFLSAIAGNLPHFEEATRALFASDSNQFNVLIENWPLDIREHATMLMRVVDPGTAFTHK